MSQLSASLDNVNEKKKLAVRYLKKISRKNLQHTDINCEINGSCLKMLVKQQEMIGLTFLCAHK